jgi:phosphatidylserine/phosphatidylglycerophosphate/cardiolipin synthase-like enzyme
MKRITTQVLPWIIAVSAWTTAATPADIDVWFSPNGGAARGVTRTIDAAKKSIHVQAYAISEDTITRALIAAHRRGVAVILIVDAHQQTGSGSTAHQIKKAGVPTRVDRAHSLQHNKTMVIDAAIVITGSMNFTRSGDKNNAENTLIITKDDLAKIYEEDFQKHLAHSGTFADKELSKPTPLPTPPAALPLPLPAHAKEP